jgi:hypothetical protein
MTDNSSEGNLIDTASSGVEGIANAATSALGQAGPAGALAQPVVDALRNVWEGYFGSPIPPDGTNWNAYTHQQLYQMLWENADVGDVSSTAAEWGRHSSELTEYGSSLHKQRDTLQTNWSGKAAEVATNRLGELGDNTTGIGARASTARQATQNAGDALADARNTMPPPSVDPIAAGVTGAVAGAGAGAVIGGLIGAGAGGVGAGPGALIGAGIGAVAGGGASFFLASVAAAEQKAEAVHVMQRYESSLRNSSHAIASANAGAGAAGSAASAGQTTASGYAGVGVGTGLGAGSSVGSGASWNQLAGSGSLGSGPSTGSGLLDKALMGRPGAMSALTRAANSGGMMPGSGARGNGDEDEKHTNRLPTVDHKLFAVDVKASSPVIGA